VYEELSYDELSDEFCIEAIDAIPPVNGRFTLDDLVKETEKVLIKHGGGVYNEELRFHRDLLRDACEDAINKSELTDDRPYGLITEVETYYRWIDREPEPV
jgi:hypothetical protein